MQITEALDEKSGTPAEPKSAWATPCFLFSSDVMVYPDETSAQCGSSYESLLKSIFGPILDPFLEPLLDPLLDACDFLCKL